MPKIDTEVDVAEELKRYDELLETAWEDFKSIGLAVPGRSKGSEEIPEWPEDITRLTDQELHQMHGKFEAFLRFVTGQVAISKTSLRVAKEKSSLVRSAVRKRAKGKNKEERDDSTVLDNLYQDVRQEELYWQSIHGMQESLREIYEADVKAISRQMTQREVQTNAGARHTNSGNVGKRPFRNR